MDMDMTMTFDWSIKTKILFDFWDVHTWPIYILSLVIVFAATVGAEALNTMLARCEARVSGNRQPLLGCVLCARPLLFMRNSYAHVTTRARVCARAQEVLAVRQR